MVSIERCFFVKKATASAGLVFMWGNSISNIKQKWEEYTGDELIEDLIDKRCRNNYLFIFSCPKHFCNLGASISPESAAGDQFESSVLATNTYLMCS